MEKHIIYKDKNMEITKSAWYSNSFLNARLDLTLLQARILHFTVKQLQEFIYNNNVNNDRIHKTIMDDYYITIPIGMISKEDNDQKIRQSIRGLMKPIDDSNFLGNLISQAKRKNNSWEILFPSKTINALIEVAKGVTPLETLIYISCKSLYTLRLYEILKQYRNLKNWYTTPEDLCDMLNVPSSYKKNYNTFNKRSIEVARKELYELFNSKRSEIYFTYTEKRGGRGNKVQDIIFHIHQKNISLAEDEQTSKDLIFVTNQLTRMMLNNANKHQENKNKDFINKATSKLLEMSKLNKFAKRLEKIIQDADARGESPDQQGALARYILQNDYNID